MKSECGDLLCCFVCVLGAMTLLLPDSSIGPINAEAIIRLIVFAAFAVEECHDNSNQVFTFVSKNAGVERVRRAKDPVE